MAGRHDVHAGESMVEPHGAADDHGADDGHDDHGQDDHGHGAGEALGPIDVQAWGAGLFGLLLGLVVVLAFVQAAG